MDTKNHFDVHAYFKGLCENNKLAKENAFKFCKVAGMNGMQEALISFNRETAFFCVDDTTDGTTFERSGGFFQRRVFTVILLKKYTYGNMEDRKTALDICRKLFNQLYSRMLVDKEILLGDFIYLNTQKVHFREMEKYTFSGCSGLYFMIDVDEPIDLSYEPKEWKE